jgi:hypothetical protein
VSSAHALYVIGAAAEFAGILLVASPDLVPGARRLSQWLSRSLGPTWNRVRRWLRLPPRTYYIHAKAGTISVSGSIAGVKKSNPEGTPEQQIAFLLQRDQEAQEAHNLLEARVSAIERESPRQLQELRGEVEQHFGTELDRARAEYRAARVVGTMLVAIGLGFATAGNFLV